MALPLGKITIIAGAGILWSVLSKEGHTSNVSDFFSGACKIVFKQLSKDDSHQSSGKSKADALKDQIDKLRRQIESARPDGPIIYLPGNSSGARNYGIPIVVVIAGGYGYIWWKGWKLSDLMFATKRSLTDACSSVAKQLDQVSTSISAAKRHLSSRIDRVDCNLDECAEITSATRNEVSELRGDLKVFSMDMKSVQLAVQTLETKIGRIDGKQDKTIDGVHVLCNFVQNLEKSRSAASIQTAPSRPALELPQITPTRTISLPQPQSQEPPSASQPNESPKVVRRLHNTLSLSGIKEIQGISDTMRAIASSEEEPSGLATELSKDTNSSNPGRLGWFRNIHPSILSRNKSATISFANI